MEESPCIADPLFFKQPNPIAMGEAFLRKIYQTVHDDKFSYLCTFTGRHRVGKSLSACIFSHLLDSTFLDNFEKRVCYSGEDFMGAVEDLRKKRIHGGAIVLDEANIGIPSREWYNLSNKSINYAIQAFGYMRPIVSMVTQDITFIDAQPKKLFHAFYEVDRKNNAYSIVKPFNMKFNKRTGKVYFVYPRFVGGGVHGGGTRITMNCIKVMKPPKEFINRYEKHSQKMKDRLIEQMNDVVKSLKVKDGEHREARMSEEEILEQLMEERDNPIFMTKQKTFRKDIIANEFGIPHRYARVIAIKANLKLQKKKDYETLGIPDPEEEEKMKKKAEEVSA
jgi:transposase